MNYSFSYKTNVDPSALLPMLIVSGIIGLVCLIAEWRIFTKAGKHGWAALIPFYNVWTEFEVICGRGTAMFRLLIPLYNIYWIIKSMIKLAQAFGKSTGFGIGLIFLTPIFICILGFGKDEYKGPQDM